MRVIADHARTTAFLIAEGVFPDRAGREYVLRRVMRRAIRHGHRLGIREPFLHEVALEVVRADGRRSTRSSSTRQGAHRERRASRRRSASARRSSAGLKILDDEIDVDARRGRARVIRGETAFKLYDTYGFPLDLTQVIAQERGLAVDAAGYEQGARGAARAQRGLEGRRGGHRARLARGARRRRTSALPAA